MSDLALLMHTAVLAEDVLDGDLHGLLLDAKGPCVDGLTCAVLVQDRRVVLAVEGPPQALAQARDRLAQVPWLLQGRELASNPQPMRLFPNWRPRLVAVHPAFAAPVREVLHQLLERPVAANVLAMLRLLQGLAPAAQA